MSNSLYFLLGILVTIIWGFNFAIAGEVVMEIPPFFLVALRYLAILLIFLPFTKRNNTPWKYIVFVGIFYGVVQFSGLFVGLQLGVSAGVASTLLQSQALFTIILASIFLNEKFASYQWLGLIIGTIGLILIAYSRDIETPLLGIISILIGGFGWAVSNIILKNAGKISAWSMNIWQAIVVFPMMLIISAIFESNQIEILTNISIDAIFAILYISILATGFGNYMWYKMVQVLGATKTAPLSLLIPAFGVLGGWLILDESIKPFQLLGIIIIIIGLILIQYKSIKEFIKISYKNSKS